MVWIVPVGGSLSPRGYFHIRRSGGLAPKFVSEILVGAPNFASKNVDDKYPKFCPLNFRFDPKIGILPQLLRLVITELPKFFFLFGELDQTLPQILPLNFMSGPSPPDLLIWKYPLGFECLTPDYSGTEFYVQSCFRL